MKGEIFASREPECDQRTPTMIEVSSTIRIYKGWIDYNTFLENKGKTTLTSLLQTFNIVYVNFT